MKTKLVLGAALVALLLLAGCATTHTAIASARAGTPGSALFGDRADIQPVWLQQEVIVLERPYGSDIWILLVADADGHEIEVHVRASGQTFEVGNCLRVFGPLFEDDGRIVIGSHGSATAQHVRDCPDPS